MPHERVFKDFVTEELPMYLQELHSNCRSCDTYREEAVAVICGPAHPGTFGSYHHGFVKGSVSKAVIGEQIRVIGQQADDGDCDPILGCETIPRSGEQAIPFEVMVIRESTLILEPLNKREEVEVAPA